MKYNGIIVKESLVDEKFIEKFKIYKTETSGEDEEGFDSEDISSKWHLYWVETDDEVINELMQNIKKGWYAHFWQEREIIVIFSDKKFKINYDDKSTWIEVIKYGKSVGIPANQLDFPIE